jgi:tryptophan 2,3-dioxygenase
MDDAAAIGRAGGYRRLTEQERRRRVAPTEGDPVLDFTTGRVTEDSTPYIDYHQVDVLLELQHPRTNEPAELSFYITGQVQELLFKLLFTEVNRVRDLLFDDRIEQALWYLRRAERVQRVLTASWEPVSTITPAEFAAFRDELGTASGFQSSMYRQLEFALGNKSPKIAEAYRTVPWVYERIDVSLRAPSLYDAALTTLERHGADIPPACLDRDFAQPYEPHPAVENAWAEIYQSGEPGQQLYRLAEALSELTSQYSRWRSTHLLTVERVIGHRPGTGGTSGIEWLRKTVEHRFFPELWAVRSTI